MHNETKTGERINSSRRQSYSKTQRSRPGDFALDGFVVFQKGFPAATCSPTDSLRSTIGAGGLDCRVRHGTGYDTSAMTTENPIHLPDGFQQLHSSERISEKERKRPRRISTGQLNPSQGLHLRPIHPVVSGTPYFLTKRGISS